VIEQRVVEIEEQSFQLNGFFDGYFGNMFHDTVCGRALFNPGAERVCERSD
jgi:hypothetical protein